MTESCTKNYCQYGLQVYIASKPHRSGHYELQPNDVNGRPYFKMGPYGFWWNGMGSWWIGNDIDKGQSFGVAYYEKDAFCPHQLFELNWGLIDGSYMYLAGNDLVITCKCIFILNKRESEFTCLGDFHILCHSIYRDF